MSALLEIDNVTKIFRSKGFFGQVKEVRALSGVSLTVNQGESIGIVGESGCGKSTLANLIVRLEEPTEGCILLDGEDISHLPENALRPLRRRIQIVFQDPYSSLSPSEGTRKKKRKSGRNGCSIWWASRQGPWGGIPMNFPAASASASPSRERS